MTCCTLTSPRPQPYPLSGGCAIGRFNTGLRWDGGPGASSIPPLRILLLMIAHGLSNQKQGLSPEETRWEVRCDVMDTDCSSRSC